jgi:hypothetical protein
MNVQRRIAAAAALVDAIATMYVSYFVLASSVLVTGLLLLGVVLLIDAVVCVYGARFAFYGSLVISFLVIVVDSVVGSPQSGPQLLVLSLSLLTILTSIIALRSQSGISEQANPMNLPVFG